MGGHDIVIGTRLVCEDSPRIAIWTRAGEGNANIWTTTAASVSSTSCQRAGERERRRHGGHRPRATGDRPVALDVPRAGGNGEALSPGRPAGRHATGDGGAGEPPHTTCSRATWVVPAWHTTPPPVRCRPFATLRGAGCGVATGPQAASTPASGGMGPARG